eukprot:393436_1
MLSEMFPYLNTREHWKLVLHRNWSLFKSYYGWIIFAVVMQIWHSVASNIAYYVHTRSEVLWDLGFNLLPEKESIEIFGESLFVFNTFIYFIILLLPTFMIQEYTHNITSMLILIRFCKIFPFTVFLRTITFLTTSLPSPSHHCRTGSTTYDPPNDLSETIFRIDITNGCGDLIFSGHTATVLCVSLTASHYAYNL